MFGGVAILNLDSKGRLAIPAKHRDALIAACEGRLTVTVDPSQCLRFIVSCTKSLGAISAHCERTGETIQGIDPGRPFFDQADPNEIYDLVAVMH